MKAASLLLALALPAVAADGFFPHPEAAPEVLRVLQCTPGQSLVCTMRCPAPADGRMPAAAVCQVVRCTCEEVAPAKSGEVPTSSAVVTFNLRELLGLPRPK